MVRIAPAHAVRGCSTVLSVISLLSPLVEAQAPPVSLQITILDGEDAMNNIRQRTAREPIVQVEDENHKPVAGAVVIFLLPNDGAGGTFAGGAHTLTVTTDSKGQAVGRGPRPEPCGRTLPDPRASHASGPDRAGHHQSDQRPEYGCGFEQRRRFQSG